MAGVTEFNSKENLISQIRKRDARIVSFVHTKISNAIYKALVATRKPDYELAENLANKVLQKMVDHGYGASHAAGPWWKMCRILWNRYSLKKVCPRQQRPTSYTDMNEEKLEMKK